MMQIARKTWNAVYEYVKSIARMPSIIQFLRAAKGIAMRMMSNATSSGRNRREESVRNVVARHGKVIVRVGVPQDRHLQKEKCEGEERDDEDDDRRCAHQIRYATANPICAAIIIRYMCRHDG